MLNNLGPSCGYQNCAIRIIFKCHPRMFVSRVPLRAGLDPRLKHAEMTDSGEPIQFFRTLVETRAGNFFPKSYVALTVRVATANIAPDTRHLHLKPGVTAATE